MKKLKYGNTNTYFINGLLFDTDMPGTMPQFFRAIKQNDIPFHSIQYMIASHYHPDHIGLVSQLMGIVLSEIWSLKLISTLTGIRLHWKMTGSVLQHTGPKSYISAMQMNRR